MKNLNLRLFSGLALVVLMSCYSIGQGIESIELPSLNLALAQRLDLGLTPGTGGGGTTCGGSTCDSANGNNYGTITMNNVTKCCGSASTASGSKSS